MEEETAAVIIRYFLVWMAGGGEGRGAVRIAMGVGVGAEGAGRATKGAEWHQQGQMLVNAMPTSDPVLPLTRAQNRGTGFPAETQPTQYSIDSVTQKTVLRQTL